MKTGRYNAGVVILLSLLFLAGCTPKSEKEEKPSYPEFNPNVEMPSFDRDELARNTIYPERAEKEGLEGTVVVSIFVDKDGEINEARVIKSDNSVFNQAAVDAVRKTTFAPAKQNGIPISVRMTVKVGFALDEMAEIEGPGVASKDEISFVSADERTLSDSSVTVATIPIYDPKELAGNTIYPKEASEKGLEGRVVLSVYLGADGSIDKVVIMKSDNPIFNETAIEAVKKTTFTPATLNGVGINYKLMLPIMFKLN